ncbi:MAG: endonuclease/exonuclease/phosphatase family protein [Demequinaceae bacterium]|nr:endonuclease/exonuclease/phosphatase family protein [Demequinaceae bacterium]
MTDAEVDDGGRAQPNTAPTRPAWRRVLTFVSWSLLAGVAAWLAAAVFGVEPGPLVWLVALTPWTLWIAAASLAVALIARATGAASMAVVMLLAVGLVLAPIFVPTNPSGGDHTVLTVATLNLRFGQADAEAVVRLVEDRGVDVLAVQELTPAAADALGAAGLATLLPYSVTDPRVGYTGTGLYSRTPIEDPQRIRGFSSAAVAGTIPSQGGGLRIVAVHPAAPGLVNHAAWSADLDTLASLAEDTGGPLMVAGDLNATLNHAGVRRLERGGLVDAADQAGAGFLPTFPSEGFPMPLAALDHVLVRYTALVADEVDTFTVPGTDHRCLVAKYTGP